MKKALTIALLLCSLTIAAQYPISSINISMPAQPSANTADWATSTPPLMITAQAQLRNGQVPGNAVESRILVTINKGHDKMYGVYTGNTAPQSGFNSSVKNWSGANALSLLGKDYTLPPGVYELCVQFFGYGPQAGVLVPLSNEVCKSFTIRDNPSQISYNPPTNLSPVDKKVFTESEVRVPLTFRWLAISPKSQEPVTYKLRVWQLMEGQSAAQTMKNNQPALEKEVKDQTQAVSNDLFSIKCKASGKCEFVWNVEAVTREGKLLGASEPTSFSLGSPCTPDYDMTLESVVCGDDGKVHITGYVHIDPKPGITNYQVRLIQFNESNHLGPNVNTSLTLPSVLTASVNNYPFNFTVNNDLCGKTLHIGYQITSICTGTGIKSTIDCFKDTLMPCCTCNPCKGKQTTFGTGIATYQNGGQVITSSTITHTPVKIIKISAEIVNFERLGENGCLRCTKESKEFGNFTGGSLNGNSGSIVNGANGYGKQIQWQFTSATSVNNFAYDLQMMFPPLTEVSCCKDSLRICTRWSFVDENCITCDTLICKVLTREYKKPGPIIFQTGGVFAAQLEKMGEPFKSWYNQKNDELPRDFKKQIQSFNDINNPELNNKGPEAFEKGMEATFFKIRNLRTATLSNGLWIANQLNPLNDQCASGDFEDGVLHIDQWSGGYGICADWDTDPLLGTYTSGFTAGTVINGGPCTDQNQSATNQNNETHHTVVSYANDPKVGGGRLKTTCAPGNLYSLRLGNSCPGAGAEYLSKKFIVSNYNNGKIRFTYALVMNGNHLSGQSTFSTSFNVKVFIAGIAIPGLVSLDGTPGLDRVVSDATNPFFQTDLSNGVGNPIYFRDWTCATIDLSNYIGQQATVVLVTTDCSGIAAGGHYCYAYIDDWCGNCQCTTSGVVNIKPIGDSCIKAGKQICVDYSLPKIGTTTGSGTIKLQFYHSGIPTYFITSPTLTTNGTYCFTIDPAQMPCTNGQQGYDVVATGNFTINSTTVTPTSPDPVGSPAQGIKPGFNNDLVCCNTLADNCCTGFVKTVTTSVTMQGNATGGYNTIKFVPTFHAGPKLIKKIVISILNFETTSSNKECLTCESSTGNFGSMTVPHSPFGGGQDFIEGMTYPGNTITYTCLGCPPSWNTGMLTHSVTWGSNSGIGYDLSDGAGDQSTQFFIHVPKKSTLSCCDDTIKVCVKYSFTDVDCKTCDTIICYKVINRQNISTLSALRLADNNLNIASFNEVPASQNKTTEDKLLQVSSSPLSILTKKPKINR